MNWYLKALRQYADFSGRARRREYWTFALYNFIFLLMAWLLDIALGTASGGQGPGIFYFLYIVAVFVPSLAVGVRRMHDLGKSGWTLLLAFIPFVGGIIIFIFTVMEGESRPNKWGPDPKIDVYNI